MGRALFRMLVPTEAIAVISLVAESAHNIFVTVTSTMSSLAALDTNKL
jgi:hypothetical protein